MAFGNSTMTYDQLGSLAANLLHKAFIETTRTVSKGLFRRLEGGETVGVTRLEFEGDETVQLNMTLDISQYRGDLNYSRFRDSIVAILQDLIEILKEEGALRTYQERGPDQQGTNKVLIGARGPTVHGSDINVLMCTMTPSLREPLILMDLMYMDADQFIAPSSRGES